MGSPGKALQNIETTLDESLQDISKGAGQIQRGDIKGGIGNLVAGTGNLALTKQTLGLAPALGIKLKGQTAADSAFDVAQKQAIEDATMTGNTKEAARLQSIQNVLSAAVQLRAKQPGRAQTLLTGNIVPSGTNTNTLLTSAASSVKR